MYELNRNHLMPFATSGQTPLSEEYLTATGNQLRKLARHFRRELDSAEFLTYLEGLRDLPAKKIELAVHSALLTLKRMPMISDLRELANQQSERAQYESVPGKYCPECYPDGWVLQTSMNGYPYKVVRRCACHG